MPIDEKQKMLAGELYRATDPEMIAELAHCDSLLRQLNAIPNQSIFERYQLARKLLGYVGEETQIRSPFFCDYGTHIRIGHHSFVNFNCVFLDCNLISIGTHAQIGPAVQIYTAWHPLDSAARKEGLEAASPVTIGDNVWIGGGAIVCPGVAIGNDSVIGAGSVVVRDIPERVVAVGNPCRVLRAL